MNIEELINSIKSLVEQGTFAVLAVLTKEGDVILRPIGGRWDAGIVDAVKEMAEKYPGCKMRLFEQNYDDWERYFRGIISKNQLL
ncbi:hypothetical protein [Thermoanaerobacterium sp. DL9XJH110]|uniref:hypothetical protein n=1 Tax=Thermoanaerobacterium sp. DL9XJH110 TaxID=3386643 RepID=UPI003BB4D562